MFKLVLIFSIYIFVPMLIMYGCQKYKFFRQVGAIIWANAVGLILALTGVLNISEYAETLKAGQSELSTITILLAIPLVLFSSNFALWSKTLKKALLSLFIGLICVLTSVFVAFFIFAKDSEMLYKIAALVVGTNTGGTMNMAAVARILKVEATIYLSVYGVQMFLNVICLLLILAGGYRLIHYFLVSKKETANTALSLNSGEFENYGGMLKPRQILKNIIAFGLSVGCLLVGVGLSFLITGKRDNELVIILTITTLALGASFVSVIRNIPKTFELGMYFILVFSIVVASLFSLQILLSSGLTILLFMVVALLIYIALTLLFSKILKFNGDLWLTTFVALFFSPPFVPILAPVLKDKGMIVTGIILGLIGYAAGTYLGVVTANVLKLF